MTPSDWFWLLYSIFLFRFIWVVVQDKRELNRRLNKYDDLIEAATTVPELMAVFDKAMEMFDFNPFFPSLFLPHKWTLRQLYPHWSHDV